ncbi:uncharacterized [Tachysurus ichikawai]
MAGQTLIEEEEWRICSPGGEQQEGAMACGLALGWPEQHSAGLTDRGLGAAERHDDGQSEAAGWRPKPLA